LKSLILLKWELASLFRLKVILPLTAFMFFTSHLGAGIGGSVSVGDNQELLSTWLARFLGWMGSDSVSGLYLALAFFSAILISTSLASELESGILKFYVSLPTSKLKIFALKFLAEFIIVFSIGLSAIYYLMFMKAPGDFLGLLAASPFYVLQPCISLVLATLFAFAVSMYFSVNSRRAWHASLYSLITLYSFYSIRQVAPSAQWFFPPYTFAIGISEMTSALYTTFFSILLICLSCYIFVRKLEVS